MARRRRGITQIQKQLKDLEFGILKVQLLPPKAIGRKGEVGMLLAQNKGVYELIDYGQVPGNKKYLKPLLYPFHNKYPKKLWSKYRWWKNSKINELLNDLNENNEWLTVIDRLGAPGFPNNC